MRRRIPSLLSILALTVVGIVVAGHDTPSAPLGPALQQALSAPAAAEESLAVWVYFRERDLTPDERRIALEVAAAALPERTLHRRAKVLDTGRSAVDDRDLPVTAAYLDRVAGTGARLRHVSRWLNAASFDVPRDRVAAVAGLDCVDRLERVARGHRAAIPTPVRDEAGPAPRPTSKTAAWTLDYGENLDAMEQANVPPVHEMGLTGAGVVVGMLDTGFHVGHESLAGIPVLGAWDFLNGDPDVDTEEGDPGNAISHGTMTLSTVAGYAPGRLVAPAYGVSVLLAKTEDVSQEVPVEEDHWVAGIEWVEAQGADLASSSLGYFDWYTQADMDGETAVTTIAADLAVGRGLLIVNSAGNERGGDWGTIIAPADGDSVLTVGAVYADSTVTYFSSPGPTADGRIKPDVAALGYRNRVADPYDDINYVNASGTSFSCPLVSGVAALVLQRTPELTPMQVHRALKMTATRADAPDTNLGWGLVDALAAVEYFGPKFVHAPLSGLTTDTAGPYSLAAQITDVDGVAGASVRYRLNDGPWQSLAMAPLGGDQYAADLPGQPYTTVYDYYLEAVSSNGVTKRDPDTLLTGQEFYTFAVSQTSGAQEAPPAATALLGAVPNPFNPRTEISFTLRQAGPASLIVFDARGRQVRTLLSGALEAGPQRAVWDGRDESGLEVGSGVYLYRLQAADQALTGKMMLVR